MIRLQQKHTYFVICYILFIIIVCMLYGMDWREYIKYHNQLFNPNKVVLTWQVSSLKKSDNTANMHVISIKPKQNHLANIACLDISTPLFIIVTINKNTKYIIPLKMTVTTIPSDNLSYVVPSKSNIMQSYSPLIDWIINDTPNPNEKLNSWPENIPAMAVLGFPFFAK